MRQILDTFDTLVKEESCRLSQHHHFQSHLQGCPDTTPVVVNDPLDNDDLLEYPFGGLDYPLPDHFDF